MNLEAENRRRLRVAAITTGRWVPSSRFRVRQYIPYLSRSGIVVCEFPSGVGVVRSVLKGGRAALLLGQLAWGTARWMGQLRGVLGGWRSDVVWIERSVLPGIVQLTRLPGRPIVLDIDDAIWVHSRVLERTLSAIASHAEIVVVGNTYLAKWVQANTCAKRVVVIPTAVDCRRFYPRTLASSASAKRGFVLGWTGTHSNLKYLEAIERPLARFLMDYPDSELCIVSDSRPRLSGLPSDKIRFVPWRASIEAEVVREMDIGLMPLADDEWTRGKCSFKMLQYMASGVPCVVSPVGMNVQVLRLGQVGLAARDEEEWYEHLSRLRLDGELYRSCAEEGRRVALKHFDCDLVAKRIAAMFLEVVGVYPECLHDQVV